MKNSQGVKKDPTRGVAILFVVVIALVIGGVLYRALTGLHVYEKQQALGMLQPVPVVPVNASSAATSEMTRH